MFILTPSNGNDCERNALSNYHTTITTDNVREMFLASSETNHVSNARESPSYWLIRLAHWVNSLVGRRKQARESGHPLA